MQISKKYYYEHEGNTMRKIMGNKPQVSSAIIIHSQCMPGSNLFHSLWERFGIFEYSHVFRSGGSLMDNFACEIIIKYGPVPEGDMDIIFQRARIFLLHDYHESPMPLDMKWSRDHVLTCSYMRDLDCSYRYWQTKCYYWNPKCYIISLFSHYRQLCSELAGCSLFTNHDQSIQSL
jgi:hypothetical protein